VGDNLLMGVPFWTNHSVSRPRRATRAGLTAYTTYVYGWGQVSPSTKAPEPNVNEIDFDVQWRPKMGALKGLTVYCG
jgi:hypothetical protein